MKLHHLKPSPGSTKDKRRVGRGRSGAGGKTAGRGTKGTGARKHTRVGFEGGQMPLVRRVPKRPGFTNPNRVEFSVINVDTLAKVFGTGDVDPAAMLAKGLVRKGLPVKVLAQGEISAALVVHAHAFSASAKAKIEGAGGRAELLS